MLKSLRNHEASSAACRHYQNQPDEMADCWYEENKVSHDD